MKRNNPWANYNGPGKGITEKQLESLLAQWDIHPVQFENGQWGYKREQFEEVWAKLRARGDMR